MANQIRPRNVENDTKWGILNQKLKVNQYLHQNKEHTEYSKMNQDTHLLNVRARDGAYET